MYVTCNGFELLLEGAHKWRRGSLETHRLGLKTPGPQNIFFSNNQFKTSILIWQIK